MKLDEYIWKHFGRNIFTSTRKNILIHPKTKKKETIWFNNFYFAIQKEDSEELLVKRFPKEIRRHISPGYRIINDWPDKKNDFSGYIRANVHQDKEDFYVISSHKNTHKGVVDRNYAVVKIDNNNNFSFAPVKRRIFYHTTSEPKVVDVNSERICLEDLDIIPLTYS